MPWHWHYYGWRYYSYYDYNHNYHKTQQVKAQANRDVALARINKEKEDQRRIRDNQDKKNTREHELRMQQVRAEQERQKKAAELKMQQDKQAHEEKLRQMKIAAEKLDKEAKRKQKAAALAQIKADLTKIDNKLKIDTTTLEKDKKDLKATSQELEDTQDFIKNFENWKSERLVKKSDDIDLKTVKLKFEQCDKQIKSAIDKTGQHDDNVGKFLKLTHGLIGATMATTANSNKLSIEISTFGEIISRECQDKLTIEHYFNENKLQRFISILSKEGFDTLDDLKCNNDNEYNQDILKLIDFGKKSGSQLAKQLLTEWGLIKFWDKFEDEGYDDPVDWADLEDDDLKDMGFKKGNLKKWKRKYTKWADDHKDDDDGDGDDDDDDDGDNKDDFDKLTPGERRKLYDISINSSTTWEKEQKEKANGIKKGLMVISPLLGNFFSNIHVGIKQSQQLLNYDLSLNDQQKKAINNVHNMAPIEYVKQKDNYDDDINNDNNDNDDNKDKDKDNNTNDIQKTDDNKNNIDDNNNTTDDGANNDNDNKDNNDDNTSPDVDDEYEQKNIELSTPGFKDDVIDPQNDIRKEWQIDSLVEIYSDSLKKWFKGTIINITKDNQGEWLHIKYTTPQQDKTKQIQRGSTSVRPIVEKKDVAVQSRALIAASIVSIDVTNSMMEQFNQNSLTMRALTVARGVEDCCMQIIRSQGTIRQSVLLAQEILKLKPAYLSDKAKVLWKAVDDGIVNIFECALKMVKVAATYFSYFLKFKQSFSYYVSMNQTDPNTSLLVSLEHLKKDVRDFTLFQKDFNQSVEKLNKEAMQCIRKCVENQIGAANFEKFRSEREQAWQNWMEKKKIYDQTSLILDAELTKAQNKRINLSSKEEGLKYKVDMLTESIKADTATKQQYLKTETYFNEMKLI